MAKIKLYIAKAHSNNSGAAKGTAENPYTEAEYEAMLNNGTWPGGYVQNLGYCMKEVVISSSYPGSSDDLEFSDDSWSSQDFGSSDFGSDPLDNSGDGGSTKPSGTGGSGSNNNGGNQGENNTSGSHSGGGGNSSGYSISKAVSYLKDRCYKESHGKCAYFIRMALEAGGLSTAGHPVSACEYDSFLPKLGFHQVDKQNYSPRMGDIIVLEAVAGHPHGHIAMFTGGEWISDFIQRDMWGGSAYRNKAEYTLFRK